MRKITLAAGLLAMFVSANASASTPCFTASEHKASQVRQLQTELMVAALKCAGHPSDLSGRYNAFIHKFGKEISSNSDVLRGFFSRTYGGGHTRKLDAYVTSLANDAVMRTMNESDFCNGMAAQFDKILVLDGKDLAEFAAGVVKTQSTVLACAK